MSTLVPPCDPVIVMTGTTGIDPSPHVAAAATAAGATSVLHLGPDTSWSLRTLRQAAARAPIGVRLGSGSTATPPEVLAAAGDRLAVVVLAAGAPAIAEFAAHAPVLVEVTDLAEAREAVAAGAAGLIARGMESGGRVGELSTFVLLQQLLGDPVTAGPIWAAGGIGPRTAAACVAGGAVGVVLESQLLLLPESELPDDLRTVLARLDGTETVVEHGLRGVRRPGGELVGVGQDGWQAASFARRWGDTAAAVRAVRSAIAEAGAGAADLLAAGSPLARSLGVELPVAQGPMTRVSDEPGFAAAVAGAGGLPFLALALADATKTERMMTGAAAALGDRPWGVGVLGFAPEQVRSGQLEVIQRLRPAYAIIAGGRPAQAKVLERAGVGAFLHVPSPGLLRQFLRAGARKFVFEGAECGGHVGPRASFPLWEAQSEVLTEFLDEVGPEPIQVFFAGGVHDARSAAMVASLAEPLTRRGVQIGVLMGTAYLFTAEAVEHGAIRPLFQRAALRAERTALLETAPGHATRCLQSPFVDDFHGLQAGLREAGVENRQIWEQLEMLNVGRLRVASKGLRRDGDALIEVGESGQSAEGLFMAGQVAVLRDEVTTIARLHASVTAGAQELLSRRAVRPAPVRPGPASPMDIAIVGMACVFPGSEDLQGYWRTILGATDAVTEVPAERWDPEIYYSTGRSASKWGGFLDPIPFDAIGYGIPPAALGSIDPTQLLALEMSHRALVDAGYPYDGADHARTGVVFGAEAGGDLAGAKTLRTTLPAYLGDLPPELDEQLPVITEDSFPGVLANVIAGRVANRLDLGGPNFTVDAACASSLAALDAACKELAGGGSDLMICGGADLHNGVNDYLMFTSAHALSPTGKCRTFDASGDGIALGEGVAALVLKRLTDAERDGDRVYAVIKAVAGASDGRALGLTAPRAEGQRAALDRAYAMAGISPREVGLVEAHGTGTVVGDRTELETLTRLFLDAGTEPGSCVLGSVKSQIGHTKCAAGLAGVIKATLALHTGVKPPTINLTRPNPAWSAAASPFAFHTAARPWATPAADRVAGVSAFGFGGTNYHAVLTAYAPAADPRHARRDWPAELFCFRGNDRAAAHRAVRRLLDRPPSPLPVAAAAWAAESDPRTGPVRVAVVARDTAELTTLLRRALGGEDDPRRGLIQPAAELPPGRVAFLFPGQGSQRPGALAELFVSFPELRYYLDVGQEWADLLFPPDAFDPAAAQAQKDRLRDTRNAQPALGVGGLAVDHLLRRLGVRPDLTAGHSYGELVALCVSGAYDPATLLTLSRERAACILAAAGSDPGTMAAVAGSASAVTSALESAGLAGRVVAANHNTPTQTVISGPTDAVAEARTALTAAGLTARAVPVACAFHSPVVAGASSSFGRVLAEHEIRPPAGEVWANRTAAAYPATAAGVRAELSAQIASPVRFADEIVAMYEAGARIFVEAGPGQVLTNLVSAVLGNRPHLAVACDGREGLRDLLLAVGRLACAGVPVNTGWLFQGRVAAPPAPPKRPMWTVDGQLVRDPRGRFLPGGLRPARPLRELRRGVAAASTGAELADRAVHREGVLAVPADSRATALSAPARPRVAANSSPAAPGRPVSAAGLPAATTGFAAAAAHAPVAEAGVTGAAAGVAGASADVPVAAAGVAGASVGVPVAAAEVAGVPASASPAAARASVASNGVAVSDAGVPATGKDLAIDVAGAPAAADGVAVVPAAGAAVPAELPATAAVVGQAARVGRAAYRPAIGRAIGLATVAVTAGRHPNSMASDIRTSSFPEELTMTTTQQEQDGAGALLAEYLRTNREMIVSQREVMLAFLGRPAQPGWPSALPYEPGELVPDVVVPSLNGETAAPALISPTPAQWTASSAPIPSATPSLASAAVPPTTPAPKPAASTAPVPAAPAMSVAASTPPAPAMSVAASTPSAPGMSVAVIAPSAPAIAAAASMPPAAAAPPVPAAPILTAEATSAAAMSVAAVSVAAPSPPAAAMPPAAPVPPAPVSSSAAGRSSSAAVSPAVGQFSPSAPVRGAGVTVDVQGAVLAVIGDRTGYPIELIELDLDLEADLSVDSIKRAEVAGEVASRLGLSVDGDESQLEDLVRARTVRAMVDWLAEQIAVAVPTSPASASRDLSAAAPSTAHAPAAEASTTTAAAAVAPAVTLAAGDLVAPGSVTLAAVAPAALAPASASASVTLAAAVPDLGTHAVPSMAGAVASTFAAAAPAPVAAARASGEGMPSTPVAAGGETVDVQGAVLAVIGDRTGYPVELIELDLDLEADLSVDSIKRAEVAGEVATRLGLSVDGDESQLEDLVRARTVRAMVKWLDGQINGAVVDGDASGGPAADGQPANGSNQDAVQVPNGQVGALGYAESGLATGGLVTGGLVTGGLATAGLATNGLATNGLTTNQLANGQAIGYAASGYGADVRPANGQTVNGQVVNGHQNGGRQPAGRGVAPQRLVAARRAEAAEDDSPSELAGTRILITGAVPEAAGLTHLLAAAGATAVPATLADEPAPADGVILLDGLDGTTEPLLPHTFGFLRQVLASGHHAHPVSQDVAAPRYMIAVGRPGERTDGLRGLFRTIAREYPDTLVRYVEVEPGADVAAIVVRELADRRDAPVIAYAASGRLKDGLAPEELGALAAGGAGPAGDGVAETQAIGLDADSVMVLVGGARGITPWFARALAGAARCRIELVGRTPLPAGPVEPDLPADADTATLRAALAKRGMRSPAEIDRRAKSILAAREVEATIAELTELGAVVRYHAADVRDAEGLRELIAKIRNEYGRVDGVVYAAGVIEDKLIADKTPESFGRVYATKVDGARTLLDAVGDQVGFVVLFGSIAAAYGNRGQSDYAAANDALDSLGARWAARTGRRALTVHWGPWAPGDGHGGMVTAELTLEYARRGIGLIDPEEGTLALLRELAWGDPATTSVVYTASGW